MDWKCNTSQYIWKASYFAIRYYKQGCHICTNCMIYTINRVKLYIDEERKDLILLSDEYVNNMSKLKWRCAKIECSYEFESSFSTIKHQGEKCHKCNGTYSFTLDDVKKWITKNKPSLIILSYFYEKNSQKLE